MENNLKVTPKQIVRDIMASIFLGVGVISLISPLFLYWLMHDYERYVWIIHGPYPFSDFGGGPFQLWLNAGAILIGVALIILSLLLKGFFPQ